MEKERNKQSRIIGFYDYIDKKFPRSTSILINWVGKCGAPTHPLHNKYPISIDYIEYFFDQIGILSSIEPRYFESTMIDIKFDWYFKDMGDMDKTKMHVSENILNERIDARFDLLLNMMDYLENKKLSK